MNLYLQVTEENIKKARRKVKNSTPIDLALKDIGFRTSVKGHHRVLIYDGDQVLEAKLREPFKTFQERYLKGEKVVPVEGVLHFFELSQIQKEILNHLDSKGENAPFAYEAKI